MIYQIVSSLVAVLLLTWVFITSYKRACEMLYVARSTLWRLWWLPALILASFNAALSILYPLVQTYLETNP